MKEFATVKEVAEVLAVSQSTVRKLIRERKIPFVKIGGSVRIGVQELEQWIESLSDGEDD